MHFLFAREWPFAERCRNGCAIIHCISNLSCRAKIGREAMEVLFRHVLQTAVRPETREPK